jgi:hypothetical protein
MTHEITPSIGSHLMAAQENKDQSFALEFDPQSGELVVRRKSDLPNPDTTVVDQIATDGFA